MFRRFRPATPRRINIQVGLYRSRANPAVILALCLIKNAVVIRLKAGHIFTTGYFFQFKAFRYECDVALEIKELAVESCCSPLGERTVWSEHDKLKSQTIPRSFHQTA